MLRKTKGGKKHDNKNDSLDFMNIILMVVVFALGMAAGYIVLPMLLGNEDNSMMNTVNSLTSSVTGPPAPPVALTTPLVAPVAPVAPQVGGKKVFKNKYR